MSSFSVVGATNRYLREKNDRERAEAKKQPPVFRSSDMGSCLRKRWYKMQGAEEIPPDDKSLRNFSLGHKIHEGFQEMYEEMGILVRKEAVVDYDGLVYGHFDALINPQGVDADHGDGEELILVDIKTVNSKKFWYMDKQGFNDTHYKAQVQSYCLMLRKEFPNLWDCRILYFSKDDGVLREISVPYQEREEQEVIAEMEQLREMWDTQTIPPAVPKMSWECKYCPFRKVCPTGLPIYEEEMRTKAKTYQL